VTTETIHEKSIPKVETGLNLKTADLDRPHEKGKVARTNIELSIEKKRARVFIEAIHKAEVSI